MVFAAWITRRFIYFFHFYSRSPSFQRQQQSLFSNQAIKILRKKQTYETQAKISELWDKYDTEVLDDNEFIAAVSQFMAFKV